jgi:FAD/FMN-containing dehydrogenase
VVAGMLLLPPTPEVVEGFIAAAEAAPEELSAIANVMVAPPMPFLPPEQVGELVVMGLVLYAGDAEAGERALAPFRALATPLADLVRPMPYPEVFQLMEAEAGPAQEVAGTLFLETVDGPTAETVVDHLLASTAPMAAAQLRVLGGAMARVPVQATAFAHRGSRIMAAVGAVYEQPEETPEHQAWVDGFTAALRQADRGAYVNFLVGGGEEAVRRAYPGATWDRLAAIKGRYDPDNLFRRNQNIPPR